MDKIINYSLNNSLAIVDVGVAYEIDSEKVLKILNKLADDLDGKVPDAKGKMKARKNNIYMKVIKSGVDVAMDVRQFMMSTKGKATEAQRMKILGKIRPKLRQLDREIKLLCRYIRYTSFNDLWREITGHP